MTGSILFAICFAASFFGVFYFRRWVGKKDWLDIPNERSSHATPTPRGGGAVIVIVSIAGYLTISFFYPTDFSWGYLAGAGLIAVISWLDDLYSLWFVWRFLAHAISAVLLITDVGYWQHIYLPFLSLHLDLGVFGPLLTFLWITGLVNSYNFMDGIDGIAALQAVIAAASWLALGFIFEMPSIYYFSGIVAASSLGFLLRNWEPARIFMGDVGSAFLGFTFAAMPLLSKKQTEKPHYLLAVAAFFFLWFFIFDSVVTFLKRLGQRKNVFSAHREHIYQELIQSGMSHRKVTVFYGIMSFVLSTSTLVSLYFFGETSFVMFAALVLLTAILIIVYLYNRPKSIR